MKTTHFRNVQTRLPSLELLAVIGVVMVAGSFQVLFYADAVSRAKLSEPIGLLKPLQWQVIEEIGRTGELPQDASPEKTTGTRAEVAGSRSRRIASARDLEEARAVVSRTVQLTADIEGFGTRKLTASNAVTGISEGVPVAVVSTKFLYPSALIEFRPAMVPAMPLVVNWLCGKQLPPAGAVAPAPREPAVPDHLLPHSCRTKL